MIFKNKLVQLAIALGLSLAAMLVPRPEGTRFEIIGDPGASALLGRPYREPWVL